jgi:hypothetical protein
MDGVEKVQAHEIHRWDDAVGEVLEVSGRVNKIPGESIHTATDWTCPAA